MKQAIIAIIALSIASCGVPVTVGISTDGIEAEYSAKSGITVIVEANGK